MDRRKKKKIILTVMASVVGAVAVLFLVVTLWDILTPPTNSGNLTGREDISHFEADYSEDVFADTGYTSKNRNVMFVFEGMGEYITDDNYNEFSPAGVLFYNYFNCVINGDYENYPGFFSEAFKKKSTLPEKFTMQKLYDIKAELVAREVYEDGWLETYSVTYSIMDNNGTFREDLKNFTPSVVRYGVYVDRNNTYAEIVSMSATQSK